MSLFFSQLTGSLIKLLGVPALANFKITGSERIMYAAGIITFHNFLGKVALKYTHTHIYIHTHTHTHIHTHTHTHTLRKQPYGYFSGVLLKLNKINKERAK